MQLLRVVLDESEAFRKAYAAAVPERKKVRRILTEAADVDANKTFYDESSPAFKEALKSVPMELIDLIYQQLKLTPRRLVELAEEEPDLENVDIPDSSNSEDIDGDVDDSNEE